jgi:hypothetical protein
MRLISILGYDRLYEDEGEEKSVSSSDSLEDSGGVDKGIVLSNPYSVMKLFLDRCLKITAVGGNEHEAAVKEDLDGLEVNGQRVFSVSFKGKGDLKKFAEEERNCYIEQPSGTHAPPDFILKLNGKIVGIECKSSKNLQPTFNNTLPKGEFNINGVKGPLFYIFTTGSETPKNKTTYFWGGSEILMSNTKRSLLLMMDAVIRNVADKLSTNIDFWETLKEKDLLPSKEEVEALIEITQSVNLFSEETDKIDLSVIKTALENKGLGFEYYPRRKFIQKIGKINIEGGGFFGKDGRGMRVIALRKLQEHFS